MIERPEFLPAVPWPLLCFAEPPGDFAERPDAMDAFSEVLSRVRMKGALYFSAELSSPWAVSTPASKEMAPMLSPGAPHLVIYHFVIDGAARASLPDGRSLTLEPGDIVVLPHGDPHELCSGSTTAPRIDDAMILDRIRSRSLTPLRAGGGGERTRLVCGFLACDPLLSAPILHGLPPILKVNIRTDRTGHWLESSLLHLVDEAASDRAGSEAMLAKLSEALFVDTLRRYVATLSEEQTGWLAGARDPLVGKSLALLHARVDHPWTIADLAEAVGTSRSVLVDRFSRYLGEPPMAYLTRLRLELAAQALTATPRGVAEIATEVGYESEAAFNRAFKRHFGLPPARYRRARNDASSIPESAGPSTAST